MKETVEVLASRTSMGDAANGGWVKVQQVVAATHVGRFLIGNELHMEYLDIHVIDSSGNRSLSLCKKDAVLLANFIYEHMDEGVQEARISEADVSHEVEASRPTGIDREGDDVR